MPTRPPRAQIPRVPGQPAPAPRVSARRRGYSVAWEKASKGFLAKHPRCECDEHRGRPDAPRSTCVDHHVPHKGDKALFWNRANWRAMAKACNSAKAAREEGGFGNPRRAERGTVRERDTGNLSGPPCPDRAMPTAHSAAGFRDGGGHPPAASGIGFV